MYKLIVAKNADNGIGYENDIPWTADSIDMKFFRSKTINNIIIMGKNTWNSLTKKPLKNRINVILTRNKKDLHDLNDKCLTFDSIKSCHNYLNDNYPDLERWIIGGEMIYNDYLNKELISEAYVSEFNSYEICDRFFTYNFKDNGYKLFDIISGSERFNIYHYKKCNEEELTLQEAMCDILHKGFNQSNRTGINTKSIFGKMFEYYMTEKIDPKTGKSMYKIPILTSKQMFIKGIFGELKWFLNGRVDSKELELKNINIWKGNSSREFLDKSNLNEYEEGECGPIYGFQWKHWGAKYIPGKKDYTNEGIDQVNKVIDSIKNDPFSRRHIISGWNVSDLDKMCLPPCFIEGTLVLTNNGYKKIELLLDDDLVLTHLSNWKQIINKQSRLYNSFIYSIRHICSNEDINATNEHPFLVKTIEKSNELNKLYKLSDETSWVKAEDLRSDKHVLCIPLTKEILDNNKDIDYYMIGKYVSNLTKIDNLESSILEEFSVNNNDYTCNFVPEWVQSLSILNLHKFIKGFESNIIDNFIYIKYKNVALSLQRIYAKLGCIIMIYNTENGYHLYKLKLSMDNTCYIDDNYMYVPIVNINMKNEETTVYNLEVADDNSYVVENIATHNCHVLYQFLVHEENNQKYLSLMMTQRSCDTFLGLPFNICSLGMFLFLMASNVNMKPYKIIHSIADMHIYENHIDAVKTQLKNKPYSFPYIKLREGVSSKPIENYEFSDIEIVDYFCHKSIKADMVA